MVARGWLFIAALAALASGACTGDIGTTGDSERLAFSLRTGADCGPGCPVDEHPLMVGTEERIELGGLPDGAGTPTVTSSDPSVLAAWVERTRLCCGGGTCLVAPATGTCGSRQADTFDAVAVRALAPGEAVLTVYDQAGNRLDSTTIRTARAHRVVAVADLAALGTLPDVVGPGSDMMRGALDRVELRVGTATILRLEARSANGELLHASTGAGFEVADPTVAVLSPHTADADSLGVAQLEGTRAVLVPRRAGHTTLAIAAGSASGEVEVTALPACDPTKPDVVWSDDACTSDADCVPAGCCHASSCAAASAAPSCGGVACTLECRSGTVDCSGRCLCLQGRCAAYLYQLDDPSCPSPTPPFVPRFPLPLPVEPWVHTGANLTPADPGLSGPDTFRAAERQPPRVPIPPPPENWGIPRSGG